MDHVPASPCIISTSSQQNDNFNSFSSSSESIICSKPSTVQLNSSAVKQTDSGMKTVSSEVSPPPHFLTLALFVYRSFTYEFLFLCYLFVGMSSTIKYSKFYR